MTNEKREEIRKETLHAYENLLRYKRTPRGMIESSWLRFLVRPSKRMIPTYTRIIEIGRNLLLTETIRRRRAKTGAREGETLAQAQERKTK